MGMKHDHAKPEAVVPAVQIEDNLDELDLKVKKYLRGDGVNLEALKDKKLKGQLAVREKLYGESAKAAAKAEEWLMPSKGGYLEPEGPEGLEKTWRIQQPAIVREVDILSSQKAFDIGQQVLGPYRLDFTPSGRYMALAGRKGHLAIMDMQTKKLIKEMQVKETVKDVVFLHNELFFAAAQKKYPYIYNSDGTELHCLKEHGSVLKLQFLRNHFLLSSINKFGQLHYQDVTTGGMVGGIRTGLGRCDVMKVNPFNAVLGLGHTCGKLTMWSPISPSPLIKMLCHHGPITAIAFHPEGHLMATAGMERKVKLWDLRKFQELRSYPKHAKSLEFSQKGLLGIGSGSVVEVWKDKGNQDYGYYMRHGYQKGGHKIEDIRFCPYEDVLGIGHETGFSTILIPGSGEPNFDSWVANPFETVKQRREKEVHSLLDKLAPETIMLDPSKIGGMRTEKARKEKLSKEEREERMEAAIKEAKKGSGKKKTKGRNKPSRIQRKKQDGVVRAKRPFLDQQLKEEKDLSRKKAKFSAKEEEIQLPKSLERFARKSTAAAT
ncbi:hypothetical protein ACHQM5_009722 [Ranunculus cassubicifolius]